MPPVLGPVSPSPMRLWSCAGASGATCVPSERQRKLISSPSRNSSMTTCCDGLAQERAVEEAVGGFEGDVARLADDDAFAGGEPVGFDDDGRMEEVDGFFELGGVGADGVVGGGNLVALHELLGEGLAGFEHGGGLGGPEDAQAALIGGRRRCRGRGAARGRRW